MPKVKIKRKSTFVDMTAMTDVAFLLLTFLLLTANFLKQEAVVVSAPSSVSEIKIPETNIFQSKSLLFQERDILICRNRRNLIENTNIWSIIYFY